MISGTKDHMILDRWYAEWAMVNTRPSPFHITMTLCPPRELSNLTYGNGGGSRREEEKGRMDHSPFKLNLHLGKKNEIFHIARKSMSKLVKLPSLVTKCCKIRNIYACEVCKFCISLYYARQSITTKWPKLTDLNQFKRGMVHSPK